MNVVHIGNVPVPANHPEASTLPRYCFYPGRWVLNLALAQRENGQMRPQILMQVPGAKFDWFQELEGIPVHFLAAPTRWRAASLFYFDARRLKQAISRLQPNIVHAHGTEDAAAMGAAHSGLPSVITFQGVYALMNKVMPPATFSRPAFLELAERIAIHRMRFAIVKSEYGERLLRPLFPHLRFFNIPNTYVAPLCPPGLQKRPMEIAFAGTITPRKGVHLLAEALELLRPTFPGLKLHLFGNHPELTSAYQAEQLHRLQALLGDNLILHGVAPKEELDRTLSAVTVLVAPSLEEMFGNQVIEALLVGTHAVVSSGTPMAENIERFGNGSVFKMGDARSLADVLGKALATNHTAEATAAIPKIEQYMSPIRVAAQHFDAYRDILSEWH